MFNSEGKCHTVHKMCKLRQNKFHSTKQMNKTFQKRNRIYLRSLNTLQKWKCKHRLFARSWHYYLTKTNLKFFFIFRNIFERNMRLFLCGFTFRQNVFFKKKQLHNTSFLFNMILEHNFKNKNTFMPRLHLFIYWLFIYY